MKKAEPSLRASARCAGVNVLALFLNSLAIRTPEGRSFHTRDFPLMDRSTVDSFSIIKLPPLCPKLKHTKELLF
jgi:hypothetical protein